MASNNKTKTQTYPITRILFLVSGLLLLVKFLLEEGSLSIGSDIGSVFSFIAKLFVIIVVIGFYCYFAFGVEGYSGSFKALAPIVLILAVWGKYSLNYGNAEVNKVLSGLGDMVWILILVSGFVFLFVRKKVLGMTFGVCSLVYAAFVIVSYVVMTIIGAVNNEPFSAMNLVTTLLFCFALVTVFAGTYIGLRRREWTN